MENNNGKNTPTTKQLIAENATRLFYELGYSQTTMRKIAEKCGITHSAIFKHYKNKNEIASLFVGNYLSWLIKESLRFAKTASKSEYSNQYPLLYYWTLHYSIVANDKNFSKFTLEFASKAFDALLETTIKYAQYLPKVLAGSAYNKKGNALLVDIKLLAHIEKALSEMVHYEEIDVNKAVLYAIKEMNLIVDLGMDVNQEKIDGFVAEYFPNEESEKLNIAEIMA